MRHLFISLSSTLLLLITLTSSAQTDEPLVAGINYGMSVQETITDFAFFDWWQLQVEEGDIVVASMEAVEGLQPLLGLMDAGGDIVARSDIETVAEIDGVSFIQHTVATPGLYTIIATRDGRDDGTTTGAYILTVNNRSDTDNTRANPFLETEFRCEEWLITNALTFQFSEDVDLSNDATPGQVTEFYRISVYGLDGFEPVIRILSDILPDRPLDCTDSAQATEGTQLDLPFLETTYDVTEDDADHVAMVTVTNSRENEPLGDITFSIGAKEGTFGQYIVVLEGLELHERQDIDEFFIRRGPFASDTHLDMYMIGYPNNRLDSFMESRIIETDESQTCDDIGRDACSDMPAIIPSTLLIGEDGATYSADRFDAGVRLDSPDNLLALVSLLSRENTTSGEYLVLFVGELLPR